MTKPSVDKSAVGMTRSQRVGSGYFDLIGSLSLELLVQVLEYLDPADIVRSQRVCIDSGRFLIEAIVSHRSHPRFRNNGVRYFRVK